MKKLTNIEAELKKSVAYKKSVYNATFKDCVLLKQTQLSFEIDGIVVKMHVFLNLAEQYVRLIEKQKVIPLATNVPHLIETSQLTCISNQFTGFYMMKSIGR